MGVDTKLENTVNLIIAYECGELSNEKILELFSLLIKSGQAWKLQGHYGRLATQLIAWGWIFKNGVINYGKLNK